MRPPQHTSLIWSAEYDEYMWPTDAAVCTVCRADATDVRDFSLYCPAHVQWWDECNVMHMFNARRVA